MDSAIWTVLTNYNSTVPAQRFTLINQTKNKVKFVALGDACQKKVQSWDRKKKT